MKVRKKKVAKPSTSGRPLNVGVFGLSFTVTLDPSEEDLATIKGVMREFCRVARRSFYQHFGSPSRVVSALGRVSSNSPKSIVGSIISRMPSSNTSLGRHYTSSACYFSVSSMSSYLYRELSLRGALSAYRGVPIWGSPYYDSIASDPSRPYEEREEAKRVQNLYMNGVLYSMGSSKTGNPNIRLLVDESTGGLVVRIKVGHRKFVYVPVVEPESDIVRTKLDIFGSIFVPGYFAAKNPDISEDVRSNVEKSREFFRKSYSCKLYVNKRGKLKLHVCFFLKNSIKSGHSDPVPLATVFLGELHHKSKRTTVVHVQHTGANNEVRECGDSLTLLYDHSHVARDKRYKVGYRFVLDSIKQVVDFVLSRGLCLGVVVVPTYWTEGRKSYDHELYLTSTLVEALILLTSSAPFAHVTFYISSSSLLESLGIGLFGPEISKRMADPNLPIDVKVYPDVGGGRFEAAFLNVLTEKVIASNIGYFSRSIVSGSFALSAAMLAGSVISPGCARLLSDWELFFKSISLLYSRKSSIESKYRKGLIPKSVYKREVAICKEAISVLQSSLGTEISGGRIPEGSTPKDHIKELYRYDVTHPYGEVCVGSLGSLLYVLLGCPPGYVRDHSPVNPVLEGQDWHTCMRRKVSLGKGGPTLNYSEAFASGFIFC